MAEKRVNTVINGRQILLSEKAQKMAIRFFGAERIGERRPGTAERPPEIHTPKRLRELPPEIKVPQEIPQEVMVNDPILSEANPVITEPVNEIKSEPRVINEVKEKAKPKRKPARKSSKK